jgi:hypothetical protein
MADPIITPQLLAAGGAAIGALSKPRNPLQGALLGGIAGYSGGTALGLGAPAAASGGGLTMGAKGVTGLTSGTGAALNAGANTANAGLYSLGGTGTTAGLSAVPATAADTFGNYSLAAVAPANYSLVAPSAVTSVPTPSFMDKVGLSAKSSYENPGQSLAALSATNSLLQPDQQMATAPVVPVTARNQLRPFNPMESMDPYRQSVISNQPISLLG